MSRSKRRGKERLWKELLQRTLIAAPGSSPPQEESSGDDLAGCQSVALPLSSNTTARPQRPVNSQQDDNNNSTKENSSVSEGSLL